LVGGGLHEICGPFLDRLDRLLDPQRPALSTAFGLIAGEAPDRFMDGRARGMPGPVPGPAPSATGCGRGRANQVSTRVFNGPPACSERAVSTARPTPSAPQLNPGGADNGVSGHDDYTGSGSNRRPGG
jgi:hypothetical protein